MEKHGCSHLTHLSACSGIEKVTGKIFKLRRQGLAKPVPDLAIQSSSTGSMTDTDR